MSNHQFTWDRKSTVLFLIIIACVYAIDRTTKILTVRLTHNINIIPRVLDFHYVQNTGTLWGMFQNTNVFFVIFSSVILIILVFLIESLVINHVALAATAFIIGGALGNITDRLLYGHVVDMVDFHFWPVFNAADSAISTGVVILIILLIYDEYFKLGQIRKSQKKTTVPKKKR
jgi:signal peptidase II